MKKKDNGLEAWEANAVFWDDYMGDESNYFHCDLVRPSVEHLLQVQKHDVVLDIACGNGNFSQRMAEQGAKVVAFDYSPKMIELAKKRRKAVLDRVSFHVCDAAEYEALMALQQDVPFTKAVCNMGIMDMEEIEPLFRAVHAMLAEQGVFVFAMHHPCFTYENKEYFAEYAYKGIAIEGQPQMQNYYHRSLQDVLQLAFRAGFVMDGFYEVPFSGENVPIIMIVRLSN